MRFLRTDTEVLAYYSDYAINGPPDVYHLVGDHWDGPSGAASPLDGVPPFSVRGEAWTGRYLISDGSVYDATDHRRSLMAPLGMVHPSNASWTGESTYTRYTPIPYRDGVLAFGGEIMNDPYPCHASECPGSAIHSLAAIGARYIP
jgi:hypothetical protein